MSLPSIDIFCPACGYDLRGTESLRCPECGKSHTPEQLATNRIPWTFRRGIGAFVRTVLVATFQPSRLALCFNEGVTWGRGRLFRWICVLMLVAPLAALLLMESGWQVISMVPGLWWNGTGAGPAGNITGWLSQWGVPWYIAMLHSPVVVLTLLSTGLALSMLPVRVLSLAKLPAARRDAILSAAQYVCGSAVGGAAVGIVVAGLLYTYRGFRSQYGPLFLLQVAVMCGFWLSSLQRFYRQVGRTSGVQLRWSWLVLPPLLLLVLLVWLVLLPSALGLLIMIFDTVA